MTRLIRLDDGHYLVPGSPLEVVAEHDADDRWAVYEGNTRLHWFKDYASARAWALGDTRGSRLMPAREARDVKP